jgi:hypothetical protein
MSNPPQMRGDAEMSNPLQMRGLQRRVAHHLHSKTTPRVNFGVFFTLLLSLFLCVFV